MAILCWMGARIDLLAQQCSVKILFWMGHHHRPPQGRDFVIERGGRRLCDHRRSIPRRQMIERAVGMGG
jgi:hypothetical protein